jgi:tRNA wybutosine-synthesizing protein 2
MSLKSKVAKLAKLQEKDVPGSYQIIGDILLAKFTTKSDTKKKRIAKAVLSLLPYVKTVCEIKEIKGEFREPEVKIIKGDHTTTVHKENDVLYKIDVAKVMFSKGNLTERKRLLPKVKEGEIIVDMFAGIGYFSIPIAKFTKAEKIFAIEKNPASYNLLTENLKLNKITNVFAILGDCKIAAKTLPVKADRVLMGYFPGTEEFLPAAMFMAKPGCVIHFHNVYNEKDMWKKPLEQIDQVATAMKRKFEILGKKKVKSIGSRKYHVVIDVRII